MLIDREGLSRYCDFNFKSKPKTSASVERPHKNKDLSYYIKQVFKTNINVKEVAQIMQELIDSGIDYRVLYFIRQHLQKDFGNLETFSLKYFQFLWSSLVGKEIMLANPSIEHKVLHLITDEKGEVVNTAKLNKLIELTEFFPLIVKRDKNYSQELYYVLNPHSRQPGPYSGTDSPQRQTDYSETRIKSIIEFLCCKLDEKFYKVAEAFCHFDIDNKTIVNKREYRDGLERLKIKLSEDDLNASFNFLDKNKVGYFNYNDFCILYQDKSKFIKI